MSRPSPILYASMHKVVLRLQWFEVLEGLARLETLLRERTLEGSLSQPLSQKLEAKRQTLLQRLFTKIGLLQALCSESHDVEWSRTTLAALTEVLDSVWQETQKLGHALWQLAPQAVPADAERTMEELAPLALLSRPVSRAVTVHSSGFQQQWPLEDCLVESLSVLHAQDPLRWVSLVRQYALSLYREHAHAWVVAPLNRTTQWQTAVGDEQAAELDSLLCTVVPHLIALRLIGPAFYALLVTEALSHRQLNFLTRVEPVLFYGLNFFNLTNKTLVILHEAVDRAVPTMATGSGQDEKSSDAPTDFPLLQKEALSHWVPSLLEAVEEVIPERYAYSQKGFQRSMSMVERLRSGLSIASSSPFHGETQREAMLPLLEAIHTPDNTTSESLYTLMSRVSEAPHSAAEILNAAWIYRLESMPFWLSELATEAGTNTFAGFKANLYQLGQHLNQLDGLVAKSLETAQLHRFLNHTDLTLV